jgi:hypothetical protein
MQQFSPFSMVSHSASASIFDHCPSSMYIKQDVHCCVTLALLAAVCQLLSFCNFNGACTMDGKCVCNPGYSGETCQIKTRWVGIFNEWFFMSLSV